MAEWWELHVELLIESFCQLLVVIVWPVNTEAAQIVLQWGEHAAGCHFQWTKAKSEVRFVLRPDGAAPIWTAALLFSAHGALCKISEWGAIAFVEFKLFWAADIFQCLAKSQATFWDKIKKDYLGKLIHHRRLNVWMFLKYSSFA